MAADQVSVGVALVAGLLSFFSPCVLPLVPVYLGYLTGQSVGTLRTGQRSRTLIHAALFVLGFGLVFVSLGAAASLLGRLLDPLLPYLTRVGGLILIVFGMNMAGLIRIPALNMEKRLSGERPGGGSLWASFVVGLIFAAGWTPCMGPVLGSILVLAANAQAVGRGVALLSAYVAGLGVPFIGFAAAVGVALPLMGRVSRHLHLLSVIGGILLIVMGFLLMTDLYTALTANLV